VSSTSNPSKDKSQRPAEYFDQGRSYSPTGYYDDSQVYGYDDVANNASYGQEQVYGGSGNALGSLFDQAHNPYSPYDG
jgi:hypothetical protein